MMFMQFRKSLELGMLVEYPPLFTEPSPFRVSRNVNSVLSVALSRVASSRHDSKSSMCWRTTFATCARVSDTRHGFSKTTASPSSSPARSPLPPNGMRAVMMLMGCHGGRALGLGAFLGGLGKSLSVISRATLNDAVAPSASAGKRQRDRYRRSQSSKNFGSALPSPAVSLGLLNAPSMPMSNAIDNLPSVSIPRCADLARQ